MLLAATLLGSPGVARAQPLDISNTSPRAIAVEFEISADPGTVGVSYSPPFAATYSVAGNLGTVTVAAADYEAAILGHDLDYMISTFAAPLVPGSVSDFVIEIDLTTLEATAQTASYQIALSFPFPNTGTVTRDVATTTVAGYGFDASIPGFPFFCPFAGCLIVPGASYDVVSGTLNAVGEDHLIAADIDLSSFARAGDLRLSEVPAVPIPSTILPLLSFGVLTATARVLRC